MLLETKKLFIFTIAEPKFDEDLRTVVCVNGIFLKSNSITVEQVKTNPSLIFKFSSTIGIISLGQNGWIDYLILPKYQNKGYATEALEVVKKFSIENQVEPFLAINNDNTASIAVAKKMWI